MTAEKYVREVGKLLKCRASKKKKIKNQLLSEIQIAIAKGEDLEDVLRRLGIPWDYANRCNDSFDRAEWKAAKREKALRTWVIILAVVAVILAVVYQNWPKWSDLGESTVFREEEVRAQAEEIIRLYSGNDFQAVNAYMNEEMRQILDEEMLRLTKTQLKEAFGELLAIETVYASEAEENGRVYAVIQAKASYSDISVTYTMTFDEEMKIAGFHVK